MNSALAGVPTLLRLALRRDRVFLPVWVASCVVLVLSTASSFSRLYPSAAERASLARTVTANPALQALTGKAYDLTTIGGLTAWRVTGIASVLAALMSTFTMVRHTRAEEESGRTELLASTVGRYAIPAAALLIVGLADLAVAGATAAGLAAQGLPLAGAAAMGASIGLTGLVFGTLAMVAAQVASTARGANGATGAVLGAAFVLRIVGDIGAEPVGWLTPLGWAERVRAYGGDRWWVLLLPSALVVGLTAAATALVSRRDHGAGLRQQRAGPAAASRWLQDTWGLAWRLQRGVLLGWLAGFLALGVAIGSVAADVGDFVTGNQQLADLVRRLGGGSGIVDAYLTSIIGLVGLMAGGYAVQAVLRLRGEEVLGRAEVVLATPTSRLRWAAAHAVIALAGSALVLAGGALALGVTHGLRTHDVSGQVPRLVGAALAQSPAAWLLAAGALALIGLRPRLSAAAWALLGACVALGQLGPLLQLPAWLIDISPFEHTPRLPSGDLTSGGVVALLVLLATTVALAAVGLAGLRRRDIG